MGLKTYGWIAVAVAVAFAAGWLVGESRRAAVALELVRAQERSDFLEARALIFQGIGDLLVVSDGDAARRFAEARGVVELAQTRFRESGQAERAGQLAIAIEQLTEAEQRARAGDTEARSAAEAALRTLRFVEQSGGPGPSEAPSPSTRP